MLLKSLEVNLQKIVHSNKKVTCSVEKEAVNRNSSLQIKMSQLLNI